MKIQVKKDRTLMDALAEDTEVKRWVLWKKLNRSRKEKEKKKFLLSLLATVLLMVLIYLFFGIASVEGNSMKPALYPGDRLVFVKYPISYECGDIVVLETDTFDGLLIKRIVGVPGDEIQITADGVLLRNGEPEIIDGVSGMTEPGELEGKTIVLGEEDYFVLGDNREVSLDSRIFGTVSEDHLKGKGLVLSWRRW